MAVSTGPSSSQGAQHAAAVSPGDATHPWVMQEASAGTLTFPATRAELFAMKSQSQPRLMTAAPASSSPLIGATLPPRREVFGFAFGNSSLSDPTVGYPTWSFRTLTTIAYFGLNIAWDGTIIQSGSGWTTWNSAALTNMVTAAHANGVRVIVSINLHDFSSSNQSTMCAALHPAHRSVTVSQTLAQVQKMHADGVNIDYEGTNTLCAYGAWLRAEMTALATEMRNAMPSYYIAVDTYSGSAGDTGGFFDVPGLAPAVDSMFVMAYDMEYSNWAHPPLGCTSFCLGPTAPLNTYYYNDTTAMSNYLAAAPASKIILGVPYYGRKECVASVTPSTAPPNAYPVSGSVAADGYLDAAGEAAYSPNGDYHIHRDVNDTGGERWDTWTSSQAGCTREMYWDDAASLALKYDLVNHDGLRGVGIFALQYGGGAGELWDLLNAKFATTTPWDGIGGTVYPDPEITSGAANQTTVFARGMDAAIWYRSFDGTAWSAWTSLGGNLTSSPGAVAAGASRLDLFARGADNALWHRWWDAGGWHSWESLGGTITSDPDASSWGASRLDVFARGADNGLWHRSWDGTTWSKWEPLGGTLTSSPGAVAWGANHLDVFARGSDYALWHRWWDGTTWHPWESLGGTLGSSPDVASCASGHLDVYALGTDGGLWTRGWNGTAWSSWRPQGGQWGSSAPSAVCEPSTTTVDVVERYPVDGSVWHTTFPGS